MEHTQLFPLYDSPDHCANYILFLSLFALYGTVRLPYSQRLRSSSEDSSLLIDSLTDVDHHAALLSHTLPSDQSQLPLLRAGPSAGSATSAQYYNRHAQDGGVTESLGWRGDSRGSSGPNHSQGKGRPPSPEVLLRMQLDIK